MWRRYDRIFKCCHRAHAPGIFGWAAGLLWGASNMLFTAAIQNTAVANVLVIVASNTVFSSIFSYLLLGELIPIRMFVTSAICFGAIALIFSGKLHSLDDISILNNLCLLIPSFLRMFIEIASDSVIDIVPLFLCDFPVSSIWHQQRLLWNYEWHKYHEHTLCSTMPYYWD